MNARLIAAAAIISTIGFAQHALAQDAGDWIVRAGFHAIAPKSDSHAPIEVKSTTGLTFSATYMTTPNWGVELLGALPFLHGIALEGLGAVGETSVLPPTLSAQYHFNPNGRVRPYAGAGINYTVFSDERTWALCTE
jgi:outer membrane protein